jgi:AcrR family transcriptional regulator
MTSAPTRTKLLDAAGRVFLARGFDAASMDLVRQQARVSNGSLYHHFPSKAHLAGALYEHTLRDFHKSLLKPIAGKAGAEAGVRGMIRATLRWVAAHPDRARLLHELRRSVESTGRDCAWAGANRTAFGTLGDWIEQKTASGEMRRMPMQLWMTLVFSPVTALTLQWVRGERTPIPASVRNELELAAWRSVAP